MTAKKKVVKKVVKRRPAPKPRPSPDVGKDEQQREFGEQPPDEEEEEEVEVEVDDDEEVDMVEQKRPIAGTDARLAYDAAPPGPDVEPHETAPPGAIPSPFSTPDGSTEVELDTVRQSQSDPRPTTKPPHPNTAFLRRGVRGAYEFAGGEGMEWSDTTIASEVQPEQAVEMAKHYTRGQDVEIRYIEPPVVEQEDKVDG